MATRAEQSFQRVRSMIEELPETTERISHGMPTFWGGKKTFVMFHDGHYDEGRIGVWVKAPDGAQEALIEADPARYYRPKYMGPSGWVGVRLVPAPDWKQLRALLIEGYKMVAPKRALVQLGE